MADHLSAHLLRAQAYADSKGISLRRKYPLGYGTDGTVWRTSRRSAVKVFEYEKNYRVELGCYRRLKSTGIDTLCGLAIPGLVDCDDRLWVLEMKIVQPPFLLDFGKAYLDASPPYWSDSDIMADWHAEGEENFGERWRDVLSALGMLRKYGIYYVDPKPGNIMFAD